MEFNNIKEIIKRVGYHYDINVYNKSRLKYLGCPLFCRVAIYNILTMKYDCKGKQVCTALNLDHTSGLYYKLNIESFYYDKGFKETYDLVFQIIKNFRSSLPCNPCNFKIIGYD